MTWKNGLVAICTPTVSECAVYGTAFPVANDLLLTARHAVRRPDRSSQPILINWWYSSSKWCPAGKDDELIVWESECHDVALLKVKRPPDVKEVCRLHLGRPIDNTPWGSEGFPSASCYEDIQDAASFIGKIASKAEKVKYFEVSALEMAPATIEGWQGASGMPVVVDEQVIGVCVRVPDGYEAKKIEAAPMWQLWQLWHQQREDNDVLNQWLRSLIDEDDLKQRLRSCVEDIYTRPAIARLFGQAIGVTDEPGRFQMVEWATMVTDEIVRRGLADVIDALFKIADDKGLSDQDCAQTYILGRSIVPILFKLQGLTTLWLQQTAEAGGALIEIPFKTQTMAELIVASAHGRDADFLPRTRRNEHPPGFNLIPFPPVHGNNETPAELINAYLTDLKRRHLPAPSVQKFDAYKDTLDNLCHVLDVNVDDDDFTEMESQMKYAKKRGFPLPYLAFILPNSDSQRENVVYAVQKLCANLSELMVLVLDPKAGAKDRELLEGFAFLIPLQS